MGNITLTKILMSALIATFIIATLFGVYTSFCSLNNCSIDEPYKSAFGNLSSQYSGFSGVATGASDEGLVKSILNLGKNLVTGTVNVFIVGLDAIGKFFGMIPIIGNVFSILNSIFPALGGLIGLATVLIGLYIAMSYIKSASNKFDLP